MAQTTLEIPAKSVYVGVVRLALASLARDLELDEDRIEDLRMAVSEACANAVMNNETSGRPVTITWTANERTHRCQGDRREREAASRS